MIPHRYFLIGTLCSLFIGAAFSSDTSLPRKLADYERAALDGLGWTHPLIEYLLDERDIHETHADFAARCAPEREALQALRASGADLNSRAISREKKKIKEKVPYFPEIVIEPAFLQTWGALSGTNFPEACIPPAREIDLRGNLIRALISAAIINKQVAIQCSSLDCSEDPVAQALVVTIPITLLPSYNKALPPEAGNTCSLRAIFGEDGRLLCSHNGDSIGLFYNVGPSRYSNLKGPVPSREMQALLGACLPICSYPLVVPGGISLAVPDRRRAYFKTHLSDETHRMRLGECGTAVDEVTACLDRSLALATAHRDLTVCYYHMQDFCRPVISCLAPALLDEGPPRCFIAFSAHGDNLLRCEPYTVYTPAMTLFMAVSQAPEDQKKFFDLYRHPTALRLLAEAVQGPERPETSTDGAASGGAASTEADQRLLREGFLQLIANALSLSVDEIALDCEGADAPQRTHIARGLKNFASKARGKLPKAKLPEPSENISITKFNHLWKADPDTILRRIQGGRADSLQIDGLAAWMANRRKRLNAGAPQPRRGKRQAGVVDEPAARAQDAVAAPQDPPQPDPQPGPGADAQPAQEGWLRRMWNAASNAGCAIQ